MPNNQVEKHPDAGNTMVLEEMGRLHGAEYSAFLKDKKQFARIIDTVNGWVRKLKPVGETRADFTWFDSKGSPQAFYNQSGGLNNQPEFFFISTGQTVVGDKAKSLSRLGNEE